MMQCQHAEELFSDYVSGETDRALTLTLDNHLSSCAECSAIVAGLRNVWAAFEEIPVLEAPEQLHATIMGAMAAAREDEERAENRPIRTSLRSIFSPRTLAFAASIALVLFFATSHAMRADLDPIGAIIRMVRPAPPVTLSLSQGAAEWAASGTGGVLTIHLRAGMNAGRANHLNYQVILGGKPLAQDRGVIGSDQDTIVLIPLTAAPTQSSLTVVVSPADGGDQSKTIAIPISGL